jgi:hypothetical protein
MPVNTTPALPSPPLIGRRLASGKMAGNGACGGVAIASKAAPAAIADVNQRQRAPHRTAQ